MKVITMSSGIHQTRRALSLLSFLWFIMCLGGVQGFSPCFTTTQHPKSHCHLEPTTNRGGLVSSAFADTRLLSVPKRIAQEIKDLIHHAKVKSSPLLVGDVVDDDLDDYRQEESTMNVILQEIADHYDASDAQGKHELLQRVDDQIEELAERMAVLKSLSEHLQMGDGTLLEDQEVSAMKRFLWNTASSLKCGKHVEFLDGKEINGLKTEIVTAIQKSEEQRDQSLELFNLQEDYYLETKLKQQQEEEALSSSSSSSSLCNPHSYDAWLGF